MPYSVPEIVGALNALSDERYYFRLVSPAVGPYERELLREWSIKMALMVYAGRSRAELESLEARLSALEGHEPAREVASTFFNLLYEGWSKSDEGRRIHKAVAQYFGREKEVANLLMMRRSTSRFSRFVEHQAKSKLTRALTGAHLAPDMVNQIARGIDSIGGPRQETCLELLDRFLEFPRMAERAKLVPTRYLAVVQEWHDRGVIDPIAALIHECARYPAAIYGLTGRQFEHVIAEIFRGFSCEVELTAATRDQGRDIVCCRQGGQRPFKFAIETKRYARSRKISVGLINQFLGANRKFATDRLLFVTTSDYTKPALKQAKDNMDILRVKKYEDVIEWAGRYAEANPHGGR